MKHKIIKINGVINSVPETKIDKNGKEYLIFGITLGNEFAKVFSYEALHRSMNLQNGHTILAEGNPTVSAYLGKDGKPRASLTVFADTIELLPTLETDGDLPF